MASAEPKSAAATVTACHGHLWQPLRALGCCYRRQNGRFSSGSVTWQGCSFKRVITTLKDKLRSAWCYAETAFAALEPFCCRAAVPGLESELTLSSSGAVL